MWHMGSQGTFPIEIQGWLFFFRSILTPFFLPLLTLQSCLMISCLPQKPMQDSLGGNSKTMIIANVSPSIWLVNMITLFHFLFNSDIWSPITDTLLLLLSLLCSCSAETLNTLKFAQRAKLIQNNVSFWD